MYGARYRRGRVLHLIIRVFFLGGQSSSDFQVMNKYKEVNSRIIFWHDASASTKSARKKFACYGDISSIAIKKSQEIIKFQSEKSAEMASKENGVERYQINMRKKKNSYNYRAIASNLVDNIRNIKVQGLQCAFSRYGCTLNFKSSASSNQKCFLTVSIFFLKKSSLLNFLNIFIIV